MPKVFYIAFCCVLLLHVLLYVLLLTTLIVFVTVRFGWWWCLVIALSDFKMLLRVSKVVEKRCPIVGFRIGFILVAYLK